MASVVSTRSGAPEFLGPQLERETEKPLTPPEGWGEKGMRVLLFAHGPYPAPFCEVDGLPALPPGVKPVAWLGFTDELRPNVDKALNGFRDAGITLKVISGDNPETVAALARQAGLSGDALLVSGTRSRRDGRIAVHGSGGALDGLRTRDT